MRRACLGLAVALAMIAPATGRAQWSRPQSLSSPAQSVSAPFLSLARSASGIAAWTQGSGVRSKALYALRAAGTFGAPRSLGSGLTVVGTGIDNKRGLVLVAVRRVSTGYELDGFTGRLPGPLAHRQVLDRSRKPYVSTPILRTNLRGNA